MDGVTEFEIMLALVPGIPLAVFVISFLFGLRSIYWSVCQRQWVHLSLWENVKGSFGIAVFAMMVYVFCFAQAFPNEQQ